MLSHTGSYNVRTSHVISAGCDDTAGGCDNMAGRDDTAPGWPQFACAVNGVAVRARASGSRRQQRSAPGASHVAHREADERLRMMGRAAPRVLGEGWRPAISCAFDGSGHRLRTLREVTRSSQGARGCLPQCKGACMRACPEFVKFMSLGGNYFDFCPGPVITRPRPFHHGRARQHGRGRVITAGRVNMVGAVSSRLGASAWSGTY